MRHLQSAGPASTAAPDIAIRPIGEDDHAAVLRINAGGRPGVAPLEGAELGRLLACGGLHLAALAGDRTIVGYALTIFSGDPYDGEEFRYFADRFDQPFIYIDQVAIDRQRKRQGVGSKLYGALIDRARARGIGMLCCEVNTAPANPVSLEFHQRLGFACIDAGSVRDGRQVAFLTKAL